MRTEIDGDDVVAHSVTEKCPDILEKRRRLICPELWLLWIWLGLTPAPKCLLPMLEV
jgi:hypothetical protein